MRAAPLPLPMAMALWREADAYGDSCRHAPLDGPGEDADAAASRVEAHCLDGNGLCITTALNVRMELNKVSLLLQEQSEALWVSAEALMESARGVEENYAVAFSARGLMAGKPAEEASELLDRMVQWHAGISDLAVLMSRTSEVLQNRSASLQGSLIRGRAEALPSPEAGILM